MALSLTHGITIIKETVAAMPKKSGVYKMKAYDGTILYVGKAKVLPKRVISYAKIDALPNRLRRMVAELAHIDYEITNTEAEALLLEASLIRTIKPKFNIALRDDKSFPYIHIDMSHTYPRLTKFRGKPLNRADYFGPFASVFAVNQTIIEIQKLFNLRPCTNEYFSGRTRPCLEYQIGRCAAPCVGKITPEEYYESVREAKRFLSGKSFLIHEKLAAQMQQYATNLEYEKAAKIRNKITLLNEIQSKNVFAASTFADADLIAIVEENSQVCIETMTIRGAKNYGTHSYFPHNIEEEDLAQIMHEFFGQYYQRREPARTILVNVLPAQGELLVEAIQRLHDIKVQIIAPKLGDKKELVSFLELNARETLQRKIHAKTNIENNLKELEKLFDLPRPINRLEVYDNSHISGIDAVGAYVVLTPNGFIKSEYRRINLTSQSVQSKDTQGGDDYAMLRETLTRRLKKLSADNYPDLMLIDGGGNHLKVVLLVLQEHQIEDIPVVAIAKGVMRNAKREVFHRQHAAPFQLPTGDLRLRFLHLLRDEAHKFAISKHRERRLSKISVSLLESIPGIGKIRKKQLLSHFGSLDNIKKASVIDLMRAAGISKKIAQSIYNHLHYDDVQK